MTKVVLDICDKKGHIDLSKLVKMTGAGRRELSDILGIPIEAIEAGEGLSASTGEVKHLIRALRLLSGLSGHDHDKMRAWFTDPKVYWGGLRPLDMFIQKRGEAVVETLRAIKDGEAMVGG